MKTREDILAAVRAGKKSQSLDGRDFSRLANFFPISDWEVFGFTLAEGKTEKDVSIKDLTKENVLEQLKRDVDFGFEKALDQRGLSAGMMFEVVRMWMWVLDDELQHFNDNEYAQYGLPLLKAVAVKYGFDNPIGEDKGNERKYASD